MLNRAVPILMALALLGGQPALANKPEAQPGQSGQNGPPPDDQGPPGPPAARPRNAPQDFAAPPPPARIAVLTEHQKRCGAQRGCMLDSRNPCPPCW